MDRYVDNLLPYQIAQHARAIAKMFQMVAVQKGDLEPPLMGPPTPENPHDNRLGVQAESAPTVTVDSIYTNVFGNSESWGPRASHPRKTDQAIGRGEDGLHSS